MKAWDRVDQVKTVLAGLTFAGRLEQPAVQRTEVKTNMKRRTKCQALVLKDLIEPSTSNDILRENSCIWSSIVTTLH